MDREKYIDLVIRALEHLPPQTVIARLTGDAPRKELVSPLWSLEKGRILNEIDKKFYARDAWQGKSFLVNI
jgi:radical SAM superfamily enzyme